MKFKLKYIKWFFIFIGTCISDLRYGWDCVNDIGLFKENYEDFKYKIYFDSSPECADLRAKFDELEKSLEKFSEKKNK